MLKKQGFTLAEVMIVLSVIGILTSILLPAAWNNTPDENLIKFKKAHNTFTMAIRELVTSDKYYLNGNLAQAATIDGLDYTGDGDINVNDQQRAITSHYFCNTFKEIINYKEAKCGERTRTADESDVILNPNNCIGVNPTQDDINEAKAFVDEQCKQGDANLITLENGVQIFNAKNENFLLGTFSNCLLDRSQCETIISDYEDYYPPEIRSSYCHDALGFGTRYKIFCIDVDGVPETATDDDCVNECPFGYGVRADGKIFTGARADEWLAKSLQGED